MKRSLSSVLDRLERFWWLVVFLPIVFFQWPQLQLPHFWDESWVYAPSIRSLANGTLSILPDALSLDLSRGHPLLFQFLGGAWMKLFGTSNESAHLFAMSISGALLWLIYEQCRTLVGRYAALSAVALVGSSALFIAQSAMLYPEMLMTLGVVMALAGFVRQKAWMYMVGLSIAAWSKESALVFLIAFVIWDVAEVLFYQSSPRRLLWHIVPAIVFVAHPVLNWWYHGWFFFPEHTDYVSWDVRTVMYKLRRGFYFLFERQSRQWIFYPTMAVAFLFIPLRRFWMNLLLILVGFSAYKILIWRWVVPEYLFAPVMAVLVAIPLVLLVFFSKRAVDHRLRQTLVVVYLAVVGFLVFSALNFFTPRYLLVLVILGLTATSLMIWRVIKMRVWMRVVTTAVMVATSMAYTVQTRTVGELNLGLYDDMRVQQRLVDWMLNNAERDAMVCTNFVTTNYLINPYAGYLDEEYFMCWFPNICADCEEAEFVIYTSTTDCAGPSIPSLIEQGYQKVYGDTINASSTGVFYKPRFIPQ